MLEKLEQATGSTPQGLLNRPKVDVGLSRDLVFAYNVLASRRTFGMAPNPIQLSEIRAFFDLYGEPLIDRDVFIELLGVMDTQYLELVNGNNTASNG